MKSFTQNLVAAAAAVAALPLVNAITPEGMLGAPRRGAAVPNPSGVRFLQF